MSKEFPTVTRASAILADVSEYEAAAEKQFGGSEVLLSGAPANEISPLQSTALAAVETAWEETRRLADLVKSYSRATTAAKTLCGLRLRTIREFYFGPRNPNGGRPKMKTGQMAGLSWEAMLADKIGIADRTAKHWMQMADAVEAIAEAEGTDIRSVCEKLPHEWTPEEVGFIDSTVQKLTQDKTQRDLLQSDFLLGLGYQEPERSHGNNPTGKNGGKKQPAGSPAERLEALRTLARVELFGHDSAEHRPRAGSPSFYMNALVEKHLDPSRGQAAAAALTKAERGQIYDLLIKPYVDAWKALDS